MRILGESAVLVRLEQEEKQKIYTDKIKELEKAIHRLQSDVVD
mgnify:CR=1 FL=1